jgi:hypothetical protein
MRGRRYRSAGGVWGRGYQERYEGGGTPSGGKDGLLLTIVAFNRLVW